MLPPSKPRPDLDALLAEAAGHTMTAEEALQQRISWVFGNLPRESKVTREQVEVRLREQWFYRTEKAKERMMTADQLREQLRLLGWKQTDLALILDVKPPSVKNWTSGRLKVPGYVIAYIALEHKYRALSEYLLKAKGER